MGAHLLRARRPRQAFPHVLRAARRGFAPAQNTLGCLYASGALGRTDFGRALRWLRKAVDAGDADALFNLGVRYDHGEGVAPADALAGATAAAPGGEPADGLFEGDRIRFSFDPTLVLAAEDTLEIEIDIRPWSDTNFVDPMSKHILPVAVLGSESFDVADVDVTTLAFGPGQAAPAHPVGGYPQDVNHDDFPDLVSHYRAQETGIAFGDTEACVTGETLDGTPLEGCDFINTQPPCGNGYAAALVVPPLAWIGGRMRRRRR